MQAIFAPMDRLPLSYVGALVAALGLFVLFCLYLVIADREMEDE